MKRILLIFICLFSLNIFCQTIVGTVFDENRIPIEGVSVYLNGTTMATLTDEKGKYFLEVNKKINTELVIRFMGYETVNIANPYDNNNSKIYLVPNQIVLKEVIIKKDYFTRKQKLELFRAIFLGTTKAGKLCKIENEEDVSFEYDYKTNTLFATSDAPIKILNPYLGYKIKFDLHQFQVKLSKKSTKIEDVIKSLFLGTTLYTDVNDTPAIKKNRIKVYTGSPMQFFKYLAENRWEKDFFLAIERGFLVTPEKYFTISTEGSLKKVNVESKIKDQSLSVDSKPIFYASFNFIFNQKKQSKVNFLTNVFYVDEYGNNSENDKIEFAGDFATKKLGDMLPMNYSPELSDKL